MYKLLYGIFYGMLDDWSHKIKGPILKEINNQMLFAVAFLMICWVVPFSNNCHTLVHTFWNPRIEWDKSSWCKELYTWSSYQQSGMHKSYYGNPLGFHGLFSPSQNPNLKIHPNVEEISYDPRVLITLFHNISFLSRR